MEKCGHPARNPVPRRKRLNDIAAAGERLSGGRGVCIGDYMVLQGLRMMLRISPVLSAKLALRLADSAIPT